jgi:hypothetical protein
MSIEHNVTCIVVHYACMYISYSLIDSLLRSRNMYLTVLCNKYMLRLTYNTGFVISFVMYLGRPGAWDGVMVKALHY